MLCGLTTPPDPPGRQFGIHLDKCRDGIISCYRPAPSGGSESKTHSGVDDRGDERPLHEL